MARGHKQIEGQLTFDFCVDTEKYVVQANEMVGGKQALNLNSAKLIRAAIMQIEAEDTELKPYIMSIPELSELLGVPRSNLYRDVNKITDNIISNPIFIKNKSGKKIAWVKIPWVQRCEYVSDVGIAIKLNDELKPYLLQLKGQYTQYTLDSILSMKSVYAIRIFELLLEKIKRGNRVLPKDGCYTEMSVQYLRERCSCEDKYVRYSQFKSRVIDTAVKEINEKTSYYVEYSEKKKGHSVDSIVLHINSSYHRF